MLLQYLQTNCSCRRWAGDWTSRLQTQVDRGSVGHDLRVFIAEMQSTGLDDEDRCNFLFKIILIGDSNVGKTCVIHSFTSGLFRDSQHNTIGVDFT
ncbi:hypothetical protein cypCar_00048295, partial [Cyprinus carpio]